jgi:hypothetical protein
MSVRGPLYAPSRVQPDGGSAVSETHTQETLLLQPLDLDALEQSACDYEAQAARLTQKAHALRQIIASVVTLNGDAGAVLTRRFEAHKAPFEMRPLDETGPRGPKAIMRIVSEHPERTWKVVDLKREMLRRGWAPSPKAVEASVKRLRETEALVPAGYGFYKLPAAEAATDEQEAA